MYMNVQVYKVFDSYKHVHTMYIHVCYLFLVYIITYMYAKVCTADVLCKDGYIYFMKCTDIVEWCTLMYPFGSAFLFALLAGL